jgi:hydrogenase maturation factor
MCFGIAGQIGEIVDETFQIARVDAPVGCEARGEYRTALFRRRRA